MVRRYSEALQRLAHDSPELHFGILHAEPWQIQEFRLEDMAAMVWRKVPLLWSMIHRLVTGDLAHARYQKCNALQSAMGIFLHSCNTPEKVIKVLARMGISVSLTSIHRAIHSLKSACFDDIRSLGRTLLASYAYDNFDVKFSTGIPTVDGPRETLVHLTSATLLRLDHGVTVDDLRCSDELWEKSPFNPHATNHLLANIPLPTPIEQIPVCKTLQVPLRAMDINQSKVSGNIDALLQMLEQSAVGDAQTAQGADINMTDLGNVVQLVHGDLGTMERVLSAMERRAIDLTATSRLQFVVFVFGLFHLKMAAADAIWRLLVAPPTARKDPGSFWAIVEKLRPTRTGKLTNNASFREQHELINHVGDVLRLDAWHVEARQHGFLTLEKWAESKPSPEEIDKFAMRLATTYTEGEDFDHLYQMKMRPMNQRDKLHENTIRTHHYLMLYEELSYAMNEGDIGRVETVFAPWILLFRAVGKHKYANRMLLFMHQLYEIYPEGLRHAIRYNMLVNPTGREHHFRAVDWVVELMNLFIKDMYGGEGSNYTKKRILDESALVLTYRNCHRVFEQNFLLSGLTYAHAAKDMTTTFKVVEEYISSLEASPNKHLAGRTTKYKVPNALEHGAAKIMLEARVSTDGKQVEDDEACIDEEEQLWSMVGGSRDEEIRVHDDSLEKAISALDLAVESL
ncbi:hypothetical protein BDY19DRAFT_899903 [Irpex rosettiformis]|uniref:Uncharacterized protein n=1 Tax=Irpex rosettiformis TaxID=378272 RepID=A0ACB8TNV8_9APHY|nr:hypothetical protein BDY19DRAFT_899903 [Irpex rosettiformis]